MALTNLPVFPQAPQIWSTSLVPANGTNLVTLVTGGANGTKIESIIAVSNNTTDLALDLWANTSTLAGNLLMASVYVAANSGNNSNPAIPTVDVLRSGQLPGLAVDPNGNRYLYLESGYLLCVSANVAVGTGKALNIFVSGGNF